MNAFEICENTNDAALRSAGQYAYDDNEAILKN